MTSRAAFLLVVTSALSCATFARSSVAAPSSLETKTSVETAFYTDSDHVTVVTPSVAATVKDVLSGWSAGGSYLVDVVSAASVDIVSTATPRWTEVRHAATLHGDYKPETIGGSVAGAVSIEPDYRSLTGGGAIVGELEDKTVVPRFSYNYSHDVAGRSGTPFSTYSLELNRHALNGELTLVLDRETVVTVDVDAVFEMGHQEKPYRYLPLFEPDVAASIPTGASGKLVNELRLPGRTAESVPTTRQRFAVSGRLAQRIADTTFILSERGYTDSWGLRASTTDLRVVFDVSRNLYLWPHARAHFQSGVSFWQRAYVGTIEADGTLTVPSLRTGDREQSPLSSGALGGGARWNFAPGGDPSALALVFMAEGMITRYHDALFISQRTGVFSAVQFHAVF